MISQTISKLVKRLFVFLVVGVPFGFLLSIAVNSYFQGEPPPFEKMPASTWLTIAGIVSYALIMAAMIFFYILPVLIELVKDIWQARQQQDSEMFP